MASSLLALLDDIASVLDDVATLTALAAKKTAGVLGDDLALNAQQVAGVRAERELPVVWAVARGSLRNKAVLVPAALAISAWLPVLVTPLLVLGGLYLCFEGAEKIAHRIVHGPASADDAMRRALADPALDLVEFERDKVRGAVRTDFILSAEIIVIALGTVARQPLASQVAALVGIALVMTAGVYGLVAAIVKLDDLGLVLARRPGALAPAIGRAVLRAAPGLMRVLSWAGTAAMFVVGGGILVHGVAPLQHAVQVHAPGAWAVLPNAGAGLAVGAVVLLVATAAGRLRRAFT